MTISAKAGPGDRRRKNTADHATLSNNCSRKSCIGAAVSPTFRQTSHAAIAIAMYKIVHTGPNSQLGGVQLGLLKLSYHGRSAGVVHNDPSPAAAKQTAMQTMSRRLNSSPTFRSSLEPGETLPRAMASREKDRARPRLSSVPHGISLRGRQRSRADPWHAPHSPKASQPT